MILTAIILYILTGILAGILAGLLGIGGGLVSVPALHYIFVYQGFSQNISMLLAIGTSLGAMVFTSGSSAWAHYLKKGIDWKLFFALLPGIICGAMLGAFIADSLSARTLELVFGISICLISLTFLFPRDRFLSSINIKINRFMHFFVGIFIGASSTILGIGGGILSVPYLILLGTTLKNAIATSAALGFPIALVGALSLLFLGLDETFVEGSIGYLYLPAFFLVALFSSLFAPLGAKIAYAMPVAALKRLFGIILFIVGLSMIF
jgi:uncharacterized membrane protein YfcA